MVVEAAHRIDGVGQPFVGKRKEKFADGQVAGCPDGRTVGRQEIFVEEQAGTFVGEHHHGVAEVVAKTAAQIAGYQFEK